MEPTVDLYGSIAQRKSTRAYETQPLSEELLGDIEKAIETLRPLDPSVTLGHRFARKTKGQFWVDAPHYLIVSGEGDEGELEETGFQYEQLVLWLDAKGIGSVWLGSTRDAERSNTENDIITLAFGRSAKSLHRTPAEFNRKSIEEITNAPDDECIQAAHLAPSGMNTQPWYFMKTGDKVLVYQRKLKPPMSLLYKLSDLDMGIGLCHYALACEKIGKPFSFARADKIQDKPGFMPFGIIE